MVCASTSLEALNSLLELSADFQHNVALTLAKSSHLDKQHKVMMTEALEVGLTFILPLVCKLQ